MFLTPVHFFTEWKPSRANWVELPRLEEVEEDLPMSPQAPQGVHFEQNHDTNDDLVKEQLTEFPSAVNVSHFDPHPTYADEE